jgi:hypothetical protein
MSETVIAERATGREPTDERDRGRALRSLVPRSAHAEWHAPAGRPDPRRHGAQRRCHPVA